MVKNLQFAEVITTAVAPNVHQFNQLNTPHATFVDPIEMSKLLSSITTASSPPARKVSVSPVTDQPSRLNHFSWEEIEGRYLPVIFR